MSEQKQGKSEDDSPVAAKNSVDDHEFQWMKAYFEDLCQKYEVTPAIITPALDTDPCDTTDPPYVRINVKMDCERTYQVNHLFGHYLADLHAANDQACADEVADATAKMLAQSKISAADKSLLWTAIMEYVKLCGGDPSIALAHHDIRQIAVVARIEDLLNQ
jgi:hypothetical protein